MQNNTSPALPPDNSRTIAHWIVRESMGLVMLALLLFIPAGRWDWGWGWAYVLLMALWIIATGAVVIPRFPELLAERLRPTGKSKRWDAAIMGLVGVLVLVGYVVAGFNEQFGWPPVVPAPLQWIALLLAAAGYAVTVWATASNPFFSLIVRIQSERGHAVATGGPYRFIRHPSYLGQFVLYLAVPILLGSWWAAIPGAVTSLLILLRTALEDRTLQVELDGYKDYAAAVRYRLIPGVW